MADDGPDRRSVGRAVGVTLGAVVAVALAAWVLVALVGGGGPDDASEPSDATGSDASDPADQEAADPRSASSGPQGTRTVDGVPTEFPEGLVPEDVTQLTAQVARGGDDWSALVAFATETSFEALQDRIDGATHAAGYARREVTGSGQRSVVYDGPSGEVLTVTLVEGDGGVRVSATLVGPP